MKTDVYVRLARHLDNLPGGFPRTESGVELRILRRLFTPVDAELALCLTLLSEEPRVIARRARIPAEKAARQLETMEKKGLIYGIHIPGRIPLYMAQQFVIGIWEFQVNNLSPELIADFEEYRPHLLDAGTWQQVPQLRTIPVGEAIDAHVEVLAYERAEELVRAHTRFAVAPCICRREKRLAGEGCDKPLETCLAFGMAADFYERNGLGRAITKQEALDVLKRAETAGLVLSPGNSQKVMNICACCGCCCGVLRTVKEHPRPGRLIASAFVAQLNVETCADCGTCIERCQMEALTAGDGHVMLDVERCIGCGLCVTTCPTASLSLKRKPEEAQPAVPRNIVDATIRLGRARGKLSLPGMAALMVKSKVDRLLARK